MASIIKHNTHSPAVPDLRNVGTILRVILVVNAAAALYALARVGNLVGMIGEWTLLTTVVEPYLFLVLAVLWVLSPWLVRQRLRLSGGVIALAVVVVGVALFALFDRINPQPAASLLGWLLWALLCTGGLLYYFQLRARALSPAITEARLQALQARIRPHFLFNSINAVLSLIRSEPRRAEAALQDMADLFRVLMRDNRDLAPLADEVELCRQYLELEQLRLGERLQVDWNIKSMPGDALVPPLMLQPLLENAVYHGIEPSSATGMVSINVFLSRGEVHAILRNPYRAEGGNHHSGNKMALGNIKERLALHYDAEASLESRITKDGYEVHIRVPYRTAGPQSAAGANPPQPAARGEPPHQDGSALRDVLRAFPEATHV